MLLVDFACCCFKNGVSYKPGCMASLLAQTPTCVCVLFLLCALRYCNVRETWAYGPPACSLVSAVVLFLLRHIRARICQHGPVLEWYRQFAQQQNTKHTYTTTPNIHTHPDTHTHTHPHAPNLGYLPLTFNGRGFLCICSCMYVGFFSSHFRP